MWIGVDWDGLVWIEFASVMGISFEFIIFIFYHIHIYHYLSFSFFYHIHIYHYYCLFLLQFFL